MKEEVGSMDSLIFLTLGGALLVCSSLLWQEDSLDVGQNTSLGDCDTCQKLIQFLVVPDGQLKMARVDPLLLVVTGGVAGQLEDLSSEVFHHGRQVDWSTSTDSLSVVTSAKETMNTADGELESSTTGARLGLGTSFAAFSTS